MAKIFIDTGLNLAMGVETAITEMLPQDGAREGKALAPFVVGMRSAFSIQVQIPQPLSSGYSTLVPNMAQSLSLKESYRSYPRQ